jgi:hypothetical protein
MTTPNQKAEVRPISFLFHNTATGDMPVKMDLVIRPEDLTRPDVSRAMVHHTLGGAWLDSWGEGIPTVQISGTTGWRQNGSRDGLAEFQALHELIYKRWHREREEAIKNGRDPDKVKLIFCDDLDGFVWVVAPMGFILRRNKSRPLLSQYQINLTWLDDGIDERNTALALLPTAGANNQTGLLETVQSSLASSLAKIKEFAANLRGKVGEYLGPIRSAVASFTSLTASALSYVQDVIKEGMSVVATATGGVIEIAANLARSASNIHNVIQSVVTLPQRVKSEFAKVAAAYRNAYCVMKNALRSKRYIPDYDPLYGSSTCSSTAGGRPISIYDTQNPFPVLLPVEAGGARVSSAAAQSVGRLAGMDVLKPPSMSRIGEELSTINSGVSFA